ncbi:MAG: PAS domain-containing protein, partial [Chloroflexi bacterium]|nr:PAS domain-containing protein [Chloroflexota bacterium]
MSSGSLVQAVLDSLDEGVLTLDDDGQVIGINRAACEILEVRARDAIRLGCPCLLGAEACAPESALRQSIISRRPIRDLEIEIQTQSGQRRTLNLRTAVLREGRQRARGGLVVFRDVSELVHLRRGLR